MVKSLKEKDVPEPWFGKKSKHGTFTPKQTRAASKQLAQQQVGDDDIAEEPSGRGDAREKGKGREDVSGKGKKKAKAVPTATADVVLGRSKYAVPDPEELRRKIVADAAACGRVVSSVHQPAVRKSCPTTSVIETPEERVHVAQVTGEVLAVMEHCETRDPGIPTAKEGINIRAGECGNVAANKERSTPTGARSEKESYHEERQRADDSGAGLQERGKRKAVAALNVNSPSSDRSDPEGSAQKYRGIDTSPSLIILKERVSISPIIPHTIPLRHTL
jgi:hypothetical protein